MSTKFQNKMSRVPSSIPLRTRPENASVPLADDEDDQNALDQNQNAASPSKGSPRTTTLSLHRHLVSQCKLSATQKGLKNYKFSPNSKDYINKK